MPVYIWECQFLTLCPDNYRLQDHHLFDLWFGLSLIYLLVNSVLKYEDSDKTETSTWNSSSHRHFELDEEVIFIWSMDHMIVSHSKTCFWQVRGSDLCFLSSLRSEATLKPYVGLQYFKNRLLDLRRRICRVAFQGSNLLQPLRVFGLSSLVCCIHIFLVGTSMA